MPNRVVVSVGTRRGLFIFESDSRRGKWKRHGPFLKGWSIYHAVVDTRGTPRIHAAAVSEVFGTTTYSADLSKKIFKGAKRPPVPPKLLPSQEKFFRQYKISMAPRIWHIEPGRSFEKNVLYAGTAPAALFRSEDAGRNWEEVRGLTRHPSRKQWTPGFGGMCLHSIQMDPHNPKRMYVAISAAGGFRTDDGGRTWKPINRGITRYPGSPKDSDVGTCVHKLLVHPSVPGRLYQQNHIGTYRSDDYADSWKRIDKGLPTDYGFGLALHARDAGTCYVVPLDPKDFTFRATTGAFQVFRCKGTRGGWRALNRGLPSDGAYLNVLREGLASDTMNPCGVYVGTGTGQLFHSRDEGRSWKIMAAYLPPIMSVSAAVV